MTKVRGRDQLLDVAGRLFGEHGLENTTMQRIADELGVLKGSLYHYVSSKEELHQLVADRRFARMIKDVERIASMGLPPDQQLREALRRHLQTLDDFYPESSQWFAKTPTAGDRAKERKNDEASDAYAHAIRQIIADGVAQDLFRDDVDLQVATMAILGMANWLTRWYRRGGRLPIDAIADDIAEMAVSSLLPRARQERDTAARATQERSSQ